MWRCSAAASPAVLLHCIWRSADTALHCSRRAPSATALRAAAAARRFSGWQRVRDALAGASAATMRGVCSICPIEALDLTQLLDRRTCHRLRLSAESRPRRGQTPACHGTGRLGTRIARGIRLPVSAAVGSRRNCWHMCAAARYLGGLLDSRSGHLHPLKFTRGLARAAESAGAADLREFAGAALRRMGREVMVHTGARHRALRASGAVRKRLHRRRRSGPVAAHIGSGHLHHRHRTAGRGARPRAAAEQRRDRRHQLDLGLFQALGRSPPAVRRARQLQRRAAAAPGDSPCAGACCAFSRASPM